MIVINNPKDLYNLILKDKLNVKQVNIILESFLIKKSFIVFDDYTPIQIVEILKEFFFNIQEKANNQFLLIFKRMN